MARAYGLSAHLLIKRETTYGQAATGDYIRMPFNRCNLGSEQGLIAQVLASARESPQHHAYATNDGCGRDLRESWA
jgi:hypothetical protein